MKLCLGTVQFGLDYGINNQRGEIPLTEVFDIIKLAHKNKIDTLDTAHNYGESEKKIGLYNQKYPTNHIKIITKIPSENIDLLNKKFRISLERLHQKKIYGLLIHNYNPLSNSKDLFKFLTQVKTNKLVLKIGISVNDPSDLDPILSKEFNIDIVQIPYNILDQRFEPLFPQLKKMKIDIYTRSAFLQGLLFKNPKTLDTQFKTIKDKLLLLRAFAKDRDTSVLSILLNFCLSNPYVKKVVIGVDNLRNLAEIIENILPEKNIEFSIIKKSMKENDLNIIKPSLWKKQI